MLDRYCLRTKTNRLTTYLIPKFKVLFTPPPPSPGIHEMLSTLHQIPFKNSHIPCWYYYCIVLAISEIEYSHVSNMLFVYVIFAMNCLNISQHRISCSFSRSVIRFWVSTMQLLLCKLYHLLYDI